MTGDPPANIGWEYLLAHHLPARYCRTFAVPFGTRPLHFCARCSGEVLGFVGFLVPYLLFQSWAAWVSVPLAGVVIALAPAFAEADWLTQTIQGRESTNGIRLVSGLLVGAAMAALLGFALTARWGFVAAGALVLAGYLIVASFALFRTGVWRRVVAEHFP